MARRRFFVDEIHHGEAEVTGDQAHHLRNVLRVEAGQQYEISDNNRVYLARVALSSKKRITFEIVEELPRVLPPVRLHLYVALVKFDRLEMIIEKATELGVERIVPVVAKRSEKGLEKAASKRLARWIKIATEASQQSRRLRLPVLEEPVKLKDILTAQADRRYLLEELPGAPPILKQLPDEKEWAESDVVALLAGPEGGWTDEERVAAGLSGWLPVSLGPQVLRTETAAIAALAVLMSAWHAIRPIGQE
jgi:16S rRNA (uracil1498-N3)-methyltransferase